MSFTEKWDTAFESKDRDGLSELLDDEFIFVRHKSGNIVSKEDMINMWTSDDRGITFKNYRVNCENDYIVFTHRFIDFQTGNREAVLGVMPLKKGKRIEMETGSTLILHTTLLNAQSRGHYS